MAEHASGCLEVWQYEDGLSVLCAWWCGCEPVGGGGDGYPTLRAALEAALAHVSEDDDA